MGLAAPGLADDLGQFLTPSVGDGDLVPLPGLLLRLLAGPTQPPLEDLADVLGVETDLEVPLDQVGDPGGGPQLGSPTVRRTPCRSKPSSWLNWASDMRGGRKWGIGSKPPGCLASRTQR